MAHLNVIPKPIVFTDAKRVDVEEVEVSNQFTNGQEFEIHDRMLRWIRTKASKLKFGVVIEKSNNRSNKILVFVTLRCKRSGKYITPLKKFKRDDINSTKFECPFKLRGYLLENNK